MTTHWKQTHQQGQPGSGPKCWDCGSVRSERHVTNVLGKSIVVKCVSEESCRRRVRAR